MSKFNCERISRKGYRLQWTGENTAEVGEFLADNGHAARLYPPDPKYFEIRLDGMRVNTMKHGEWVVKGEDGKLRFYSEAKMLIMYKDLIEIKGELNEN